LNGFLKVETIVQPSYTHKYHAPNETGGRTGSPDELRLDKMPPRKKRPDPASETQILAGVRRDQALREQSYREQALKLFPHVCARCCREFSGKRLRELTVHHKDNDHMNNPPDGSNWELLCLYCHDNEHQDYERSGYYEGSVFGDSDQGSPSGFRPFEGLKELLKPKSEESESG
jgi:hypothetical protein